MTAPNYSPAALDYFARHAIRAEVAAEAGVTEKGGDLVFPWPGADGRPSWRRRSLTGRSLTDREWQQEAGSSHGVHWPFGAPLPGEPGTVLVTEGAPDALAAWSVRTASTAQTAALLAVELLAVAAVASATTPPERLVAALTAARVANVVLALDGDDAGRKATPKLTDALRDAGIRAAVIELPDGDDLADVLARLLAREEDPAWWLADALLNAVDADVEHSGDGDAPTVSVPPLRMRTGREIRASSPERPPWIWDGYLARGAVTLLSGSPKAGKSTLALALAAAVAEGQRTFLGRNLDPGPVLYVTEEDDGTLRPKLFDDGHFATRNDLWPAPAWPALLAGLTAATVERRAHLVVIDTFAHWAQLGGDQEKDAGHVQRALGHVQRALGHVHGLARAGCAVLLVHHTRKGGGEHGEAVRGSGALLGAVDASVELERPRDAPHGRRQLVYLGRWESAPPVLLIDRDPDGGYEAAGHAQDRQQAADDQLPRLLLEAIEAGPEMTRDEVFAAVRENGCTARNDALSNALSKLFRDGDVTRSGLGKKGDPYRYEKACPEACPDPIPALGQAGIESATAHRALSHPRSLPVGGRGWETNGTAQNPARPPGDGNTDEPQSYVIHGAPRAHGGDVAGDGRPPPPPLNEPAAGDDRPPTLEEKFGGPDGVVAAFCEAFDAVEITDPDIAATRVQR